MSVERIEGRTKLGKQGYLVRWREYSHDHPTGRPRKKTVYGRREAEELDAAKKATHGGGLADVLDRGVTLRTAADQWLIYYLSDERHNREGRRKVEPTSWDRADQTLARLLAHFGEDYPLADLTRDELYTFVDDATNLRTGRPLAPGSKERIVGVLKSFLTDAVDPFKWLEHSPAAGLKSKWTTAQSRAQRTGRRALVPALETIERIGKQMDVLTQPVLTKGGAVATRPCYANVIDAERFRPSDRLWAMAYTGFRFSELRGVRLDDVETFTDRTGTERRRVHLTQVWPRDDDEPRPYGKSDVSLRTVPLPKVAWPAFDRLADYSRCGMLLTGTDGLLLGYETWRNWVARARDAAGLPNALTTHWMRHFAASMWIASGAPAFEVMQLGGWSNHQQVEERYGHLFQNAAAARAAALDELDLDAL